MIGQSDEIKPQIFINAHCLCYGKIPVGAGGVDMQSSFEMHHASLSELKPIRDSIKAILIL